MAGEIIERWTGRYACAFQDALHLTQEQFAAKLGVARRTVTTWHERPDTAIRPAVQQILDRLYESTDDNTKTRFAAAVHRAGPPAGTDVPVPQAVNRIRRGQFTDHEAEQLSTFAGEVVDLDLRIDLTIARDGSSVVTYTHELVNMTDRPFTRLARELWFVYTTGKLLIEAVEHDGHRVIIQRAATTPNLCKFACQISPALQPGDSATVAYTCQGGRFVDEWYWREAIRRPTRRASIVMRRQNAGRLVDCSATVEQADGSDRSAVEGLVWDYDQEDFVMKLTSNDLNPNHTLVIRWDIDDESPR